MCIIIVMGLFVMIVLISSYWNVNDFVHADFCLRCHVLISSYWNVNRYDRKFHFCCEHLNLFILECKYCFLCALRVQLLVLISSYWNVNNHTACQLPLPFRVLISSYWNVNKYNSLADAIGNKVLISSYWNVNTS